MLRILMKTASSMGKSGGSVSAERYDESDLSTWELVNASQSDDEDRYSFDGEDVTSDSDGVIGSDEPSEEAYEVDVISIQPMSISPPMTLPVEMTLSNHVYLEDDDDEHEQDDCDDGDDDDAGEYDDELVPWKLKGRFGKQRIMKLGKRGPKPNKAKRMPICYNRPGILYGKQGFGVQHSFI